MAVNAKVGAVVLTYNSTSDLPICLDGLLAQRGVDARIVVVDNASHPEDLVAMETTFRARVPHGAVVDADEAVPAMFDTSRAVFLRNRVNGGYSAGNNIGARLAVAAGCEAVLIVNPDVRLADPDYLARLSREMRGVPDWAVGASRILSPAGADENPLRELTFWEELLWIRQYLPGPFHPPPYVPAVDADALLPVEKLHGCCLMLRASFLEEIGYLDDNVFLYSEEPILAAQVRLAGKRMMLFPGLSAVHAHVASSKGNPSRRMLIYIQSRLYYLRRYSGYGPVALAALRLSYGLLSLYHAAKSRRKAKPLNSADSKDTAA
jgi:GT2 family glycosyltransferase